MEGGTCGNAARSSVESYIAMEESNTDAEESKDPTDDLTEGWALARQGEYARAVDPLLQAVRKDPRHG